MNAQKLASIISVMRSIATTLVDDVESVEVYLRADGQTIQINVSRRDLGKLIGKQGRTSRSMQTILGAMAMQAGLRMQLQLAATS